MALFAQAGRAVSFAMKSLTAARIVALSLLATAPWGLTQCSSRVWKAVSGGPLPAPMFSRSPDPPTTETQASDDALRSALRDAELIKMVERTAPLTGEAASPSPLKGDSVQGQSHEPAVANPATIEMPASPRVLETP